MTINERPVFILKLRAEPGTDAIRELRAFLKLALRRFHLRCIDAREDTTPTPEEQEK